MVGHRIRFAENHHEKIPGFALIQPQRHGFLDPYPLEQFRQGHGMPAGADGGFLKIREPPVPHLFVVCGRRHERPVHPRTHG